jgi:hypothetical protein
MSNELQAFALKNALAEIKNTCPDVSNTFIFTNNGELLAKDEDTEEKTAVRAADALESVFKRTDVIGGFESAFFYNPTNQMSVFRLNDYYLTVVSSEAPDKKDSANLARILIPTILGLTEKIRDFSQKKAIKIRTNEDKPSQVKKAIRELTGEKTTPLETEHSDEQLETEAEPEPFLPDPPVTQFMVENVGGLLAPSDTVRIDNAVMQQWKDLYGEKTINEVDIETLNGQTIRCKFKAIKDSKHDGRGIIQLPQKIQHLLQISKGELVVVKPAIK